jgi:4-hydroxybenzoate polyprenyltransferase
VFLALLKTMRPRQWAKNGLVFVPLFFDGKLTDPTSLARTTGAFIMFCLLSSAVYIMNDLRDIENDRQHPIKRSRPLAAGKLNPTFAAIIAIFFVIISLVGGYFLEPALAAILLGYLLLQIAYNAYLKNVVLLDVMVVAAGFILRVGAGVVVINVERFSPWLYVCTWLLALFLALGKRRHELMLLGHEAGNHRSILDDYNLELIDWLIAIVTTSAVVAYSLYTFLSEGLPPNNLMMLTIPFVLYAVFRYLYLIHVRHEGGAPEEIFFRDRPMQASIFLCIVVVFLVLYVVV